MPPQHNVLLNPAQAMTQFMQNTAAGVVRGMQSAVAVEHTNNFAAFELVHV